ncbi:ribonuclease HI [Agrobacterium sp. a22-2]|nr:ribonuclease HI [Agrobacterium sp. a22-2]
MVFTNRRQSSLFSMFFPPTAAPVLHIFTDGSFDPASRHGGWAFVACRAGVEVASGFGGVSQTTNNTMELMALLQAARWLHQSAGAEPAVLWSDSGYAVEGCNRLMPIWRNNGWKVICANAHRRRRTIPDRDLWQAVDVELDRNPLITVAWCKGHSGLVGNERADALAETGRLSIRT